MDIKELAQMYLEMRAAQNAYFKHRSKENLEISKAKEKALDEVAKEIVNPTIKNQTSLFNG